MAPLPLEILCRKSDNELVITGGINVSGWTKVVTEPLGIAGFALFLVFMILSRARHSDERRLLSKTFLAMAVISLAGGFALAYLKAANRSQSKQLPAQQQTNQVQQTTTGTASPAVQGVQGDVTVTVDQSNGEPKKTTEKKSNAKSH